MKKLRILLVDDHTLIRKGIMALMQNRKEFEVVGEAGDGYEAVVKARSLQPDVILMDIHMPHCDGLEATRLILEELPDVNIVILTVSADNEHLLQALQAGAKGYLLKDMEPRQLFELLQGVARGEEPCLPRELGRLLRSVAARTARTNGTIFAASRSPGELLTPREKEVLQLVVKGASNKEIAEALCISENTVKNHLRKIMEKLRSKNRAEAAVHAVQQGLVQHIL
ncbi:response regulator [Calderihabitans maritimus]|uniref:Stage 0 sporulation protein A homolog n=1 Tax=Calderihabitans maritimus TaxID=1246530 RepID=A0A1Z5HUR7_9FIRM|nr:response regulator transcription factor [Calderihabitans maritimus]GAW93254.1 LuxR family two component transcriptional regulator [Calderihabitans maritimus]